MARVSCFWRLSAGLTRPNCGFSPQLYYRKKRSILELLKATKPTDENPQLTPTAEILKMLRHNRIIDCSL